MKVLVTGGAGFIGSHLSEALLARGHQVRVLDALVPQVHGAHASPRNVPRGAEFIRGDVREPEGWQDSLTDVDAVIHLAAEVGVGQSLYEITRYVDANTRGTALLWELLAHEKTAVRKVVVASSMSIYGEGAYRCPQHGRVAPPLRAAAQLNGRNWELECPQCRAVLLPMPTPEDKPLAPNSTYAITKRDQEELSLTLGRAYEIPTVALRFFNVYGSRQALSNPYTGVMAIFGARLKNGQPPLIYEDGLQTRDFIHVADVVRALILSLEKSEGDGLALNVGTGRAHTILDIAHVLGRTLSVALEPEVTQRFRAGDIRHCIADISLLRATYGFEPQYTLEQGVREWWDWAQREDAQDHVLAANAELVAHRLIR